MWGCWDHCAFLFGLPLHDCNTLKVTMYESYISVHVLKCKCIGTVYHLENLGSFVVIFMGFRVIVKQVGLRGTRRESTHDVDTDS